VKSIVKVIMSKIGILELLRSKKKFYEHFTNSKDYWESRYQKGGTSGSGSTGRLRDYKAQIVNELVSELEIKSIIEFGSGDGEQANLIKDQSYLGLEVSASALAKCKTICAGDDSKSFLLKSDFKDSMADMTVSLDVLFHLVETKEFVDYLNLLFKSASKYVLIYSSNFNPSFFHYTPPHVRHRRFVDHVDKFHQDFNLIKVIKNPYPYDKSNPDNTSLCDFYLYMRK
jgi:hypothetical protein